MPRAKITSKGQITLPIRIREALQLHVGENVMIDLVEGKAVLEKERKGDIIRWGREHRKKGAKVSVPSNWEAGKIASEMAGKYYDRKVREGRA